MICKSRKQTISDLATSWQLPVQFHQGSLCSFLYSHNISSTLMQHRVSVACLRQAYSITMLTHSRPKYTQEDVFDRRKQSVETGDRRKECTGAREDIKIRQVCTCMVGTLCNACHYLQQTIVLCSHNGLCAIDGSQLREQVGHMFLHCHQ